MNQPASVTLHVLGPLRAYSGGVAEVPLRARTVHEALRELEATHPTLFRQVCDETGALRRHLNVFVNTHHVRDLAGLSTPLEAGDVISILPAVSGG